MAFIGKMVKLPVEINVIIVRHAPYGEDGSLLEEGWKASEEKGAELKEQIPHRAVIKFQSSPVLRAKQTTVGMMKSFYSMKDLCEKAGINKTLEKMNLDELTKLLGAAKARERKQLGILCRKEEKEKEFEDVVKRLGVDLFYKLWSSFDKELLKLVEPPDKAVARFYRQTVKLPIKIASKRAAIFNIFRRRPVYLIMATHTPLPEVLIRHLAKRDITSFGNGRTFSNLEHVTLQFKRKGDEPLRATLFFRGEKIPLKLPPDAFKPPSAALRVK